MQDIFSSFKTVPYTFLALGQGGIYGNKTLTSYEAEGVFKQRRGVSKTAFGENPVSTSTLHIRPLEAFVSIYSPIEGNGIIVNGNEYRIVGSTDGFNYETNVLEHITLTLQVEEHTA